MEDQQILDLYWNRDEQAIDETVREYGGYCRRVAGAVLDNPQDVEEVVADTWLRAWNSIPPQRPKYLKLFLAKITRNLALNTWRDRNAVKRGGGQAALTLEELTECVQDTRPIESGLDIQALKETIEAFLHTVSAKERKVFVRRYFFLDTTAEIAGRYGLKESNVLMILSRTRGKLKDYLIREGYNL